MPETWDVGGWPWCAVLSVLLVESRNLVDTPSLSTDEQRSPDEAVVQRVHDALGGLLVGTGVTLLGLASMVVFVVALAAWLRDRAPGSLAPAVMQVGAAATAAAVLVGFGMAVVLGAASEESSPATVAAVYIAADSLGYIGWTAFGLVTGGVAAAARHGVLPRWIMWFSAVTTAVLGVCAFLPFFSWAPALLWLLVVGLGLAISHGTTPVRPLSSTS